MLDDVTALRCASCGESFRPARRARCPQCADGGALRFEYRLPAAFERSTWSRREPWLWRFRELLPFDEDLDPPPLQVGMTPLYGSPRLAQLCGVRGLFVKDESRNPTGRTADRAAALLVADALAGESAIVAGSLSSSVAAFAASAQHPMAALLEANERADVSAFGARVLRLDAKLDRTAALLRLHEGGFRLGDAPNPLAFEGLKTLGLELGDQLAERLPDWIAVDGAQPQLAEAVGAGLELCAALGLFRQPPQILATRAADVVDAEAFADAARRALGLPISAAGAVALAGLARAVRDGRVPADALALAVVEAPTAPPADALNATEPLRDYDSLVRAARTAVAR